MGIEDHPSNQHGNPYLPHSLRDNVIPFRRRAAPTMDTVNGVPVGTSVQIQEWVGDDSARAQSAWEQEKGKERPRVTLLNHLHTILKRQGEAPAAIEGGPAGLELETPPAGGVQKEPAVVDGSLDMVGG